MQVVVPSQSAGAAAVPSYRVFCSVPLTGSAAVIGLHVCDAVKLAIRDVNAQGRLPFRLHVVQMDDQSTPTVAQEVAARAAATPHTLAVIGPIYSSQVKASAAIYSQAGLLDVTPCATADDLTHLGTKSTTIYRTVATDGDEGAAESRDLVRANLDRIVVVNDGTPYGQAVARAATANVTTPAGVLGRYSISSQSRIKTAAAAVMSSSAEAVIATGYEDKVASFVRALRYDGSSIPIVTDDGARDPSFFTITGTTGTGVMATSPYADPSASAKGRKFARRFLSRFGDSPTTCTMEAYDTARALGAALQHAGSTPSRKAVRRAFRKVDYAGITKRIRFRANHELLEPRVFQYDSDGSSFQPAPF